MSEKIKQVGYMIEEARQQIEELCTCKNSDANADCPACQAIILLCNAVDNLNR